MTRVNKELYGYLKAIPKEIECDDCKQVWLLQYTDVKEEWLEAKGKQILVTYFTCPRCGKVYVICIDDSLSLRVKNLLGVNLKRINKLQSKGKNPTEKQLVKVEKQRKELIKLRTLLKQQYDGLFYQKSNPTVTNQ